MPRSHTRGPGLLEHTARKSRCSLLYCHRLAKRLEAARDDFSLSGLGERGQLGNRRGQKAGRGRWARIGGGAHLSRFFLMKTSFRSPSK